jgi:hypothetical protein
VRPLQIELSTAPWEVHQVCVTVSGNRATMIYEDGSGSEHARQEIPYADFPMHAISFLPAGKVITGSSWPSEY